MLRSNHLILFSFLFVVANVIASRAFGLIAEDGFIVTAQNYFGTSLIIWLTILIASQVLVNLQTTHATRKELLFSLALMILCLIPSTTFNWLCLGLYALLMLGNKPCRPALILIAIIAFREPIVSQLLKLFAEYILLIDVWFVQFATYLSAESVRQVGNILFSSAATSGAGHGVMILAGCSSLANLSLASLLYYSLNFSIDRIYMVVIAVISLNSLRLSLMLHDAQYHDFFHNGFGAAGFEISIILSVLIISHIGRKLHA